jgi:DNA-directed RNA polymerase specialized sigma24 family protein
MKYAEGVTAVEVAVRLSRTADTVDQALARIRRALRECAEGELTAPEPPSVREVPS